MTPPEASPAHSAPPHDAAALRAGGEAAFRLLFDEQYGALLGFARSLTREAAAAEDLVQEAFVRLWDRREGLEGSTVLRAYLFRIVRNLAFNLRRDVTTRERLLADPVAREVGTNAAPLADARLGERELGERLTALMAELPPRQREAITLSRVVGLSHAEVSEAMGCSPRTVNNHLVAALNTLRRRLGESGALVASLAWWIS